MKNINIIAFILMAAGALNWLFVGVFDVNVVAALFGADTVLANLTYILVGLAAVVALASYPWGVRSRDFTFWRHA